MKYGSRTSILSMGQKRMNTLGLYRDRFRKWFGRNLADFYSAFEGFDIIKFDEEVLHPNGDIITNEEKGEIETCKEAVLRLVPADEAQEALDMVLFLIVDGYSKDEEEDGEESET